MKPYKLAYVFRCRFRDGTHLFQNPDDVSATDPARSAYYDVARRLSEVEMFALTDGRTTLTLDLRDGMFDLNGVRFRAGDPPPSVPMELVYHRRVTRHFASGSMAEIGVEVEYCMGWRAGDSQAVITLSNK